MLGFNTRKGFMLKIRLSKCSLFDYNRDLGQQNSALVPRVGKFSLQLSQK